MRKSIGTILAGASYLIAAATALAASNVPLVAPTGSITGLCLTAIPQFLVSLFFLVGVVLAVIFLIYGGIKWILSGGDKAGVESARSHIIAAIVGLIIVVGAFFIIGIIFQLLGQPNPITDLSIPALTPSGLLKCP